MYFSFQPTIWSHKGWCLWIHKLQMNLWEIFHFLDKKEDEMKWNDGVAERGSNSNARAARGKMIFHFLCSLLNLMPFSLYSGGSSRNITFNNIVFVLTHNLECISCGCCVESWRLCRHFAWNVSIEIKVHTAERNMACIWHWQLLMACEWVGDSGKREKMQLKFYFLSAQGSFALWALKISLKVLHKIFYVSSSSWRKEAKKSPTANWIKKLNWGFFH